MIPCFMAEREEELKSFLMKVKEESEKVGLQLNIQELKSWHLAQSDQIRSDQWLSRVRLFATP